MTHAATAGGGTRRRVTLLWVLAGVITLGALAYQRIVGPTRPSRGRVEIADEQVRYKLRRSAGGFGDHPVQIVAPDASIGGVLQYRRHKTDEAWTTVAMGSELDKRGRMVLTGWLPRQPSGGKVTYRVFLHVRGEESANADAAVVPVGSVAVPPEGPLVLRFRGHVPLWILIPHVALMFLGMLWSNRAGLEAIGRSGNPRRFARWSLLLLGVGGLVLGPMVQYRAFGEAWTGVPFGWDLTDNKTLIAVAAWAIAFFAARSAFGRSGSSAGAGRRVAIARACVLGAAVVTLVIFSIPHSVMGTELDYTTGKRIIAP